MAPCVASRSRSRAPESTRASKTSARSARTAASSAHWLQRGSATERDATDLARQKAAWKSSRVGYGQSFAALLWVTCAACSGATNSAVSGSAAEEGAQSCQAGHTLTRASYDLSKSRFAFGSVPTRDDENGLVRWEGAQGVVAIERSGREMGIMNAGAPEVGLPDWSDDPVALQAHVTEYFAEMGVASRQMSSSVHGGSDGRTISLQRNVDGIPVVESIGFGRLNNADQSTSEGFYWPTVPSDIVTAARALRDRRAEAAALAAYRTKLPAEAQGDGRVVIHHSDDFQQRVLVLRYVRGLGSTASFDAEGNPVRLGD